jgi:HK97 gp10 family phage protein
MARNRYANSSIVGMRELEQTLKQLEKLPQKFVTKAARQGANVALKAAKAKAPVDTGMLKKGLKLVGEKARTKGKKVYEVTFDRNMNDIFQKKSANLYRRTRGRGRHKITTMEHKQYYYPASQEYGFMTRGGGYTPGYRYLRYAIDENKTEIENKMVQVMTNEIDKIR